MLESTAAKVLAGLEGVALLIMTIAISWKVSFVAAILILIVSIPMAILYLYDVDCTFTGQCSVWGWIKTAIASIYYVVVVIAMIALMNVKTQPEEETKK